MNLRQLEAFRATMRTGSITAAAQFMHISQPSVSRLIGDLQEKLGFELFIRSGRGLVATIEARRFYEGVESMFIGQERLQELAAAIKSTSGGIISLGVIQAVSGSVVPKAVSAIYHQREDVKVMTYVRNTPAIVNAVQMQQFDLGVVGRAPPYEGVEVLFETTLPYLCLVPEAHYLAKSKGPIDLGQLADTVQFITSGGVYPDEMVNIDHDFSKRLIKNSRLSAANMPMAASLARETGLLAIVDSLTADAAIRIGGVVARPIQQKLHYHIAIITRGLDSLSLEARELATLLANQLK